jgi:hypothetical protein
LLPDRRPTSSARTTRPRAAIVWFQPTESSS